MLGAKKASIYVIHVYVVERTIPPLFPFVRAGVYRLAHAGYCSSWNPTCQAN
jgi:hypothetical protein